MGREENKGEKNPIITDPDDTLSNNAINSF